MATIKSHSWWWNSHISPRNSKWLSENLQEIDRLVNEMLKLIEEDGDSFAKKAQMYYQRRPALICHVEDFYRMYRALAVRYDHVISDLAKNIPTELQSQGSVNGSELSVEVPSLSIPSSPDRTSEHKLNCLKPHWSSDHSRKCSDEVSSESGSECDNVNIIDDYEKFSKLEARIIELERELRETQDKLDEFQEGDKEHCEDLVKKEHFDSLTQPVAAYKNFTDLVEKFEVFQEYFPDCKEGIKNLMDAMEASVLQFEIELSCRDNTIKEYNAWLGAVLTKFDHVIEDDKDEQKLSRKIQIFEKEQVKEGKTMEAQALLEAKLSHLMASISSYESKLRLFEERVMHLESEKSKLCTDSEKHVSELNENLEEFKMKVDVLMSEKDLLNGQVIRLLEDTEIWDDESRKIDEQLHELQLEHEKLIQEVEDARNVSVELTNKVKELEEEVERQKGVIIDCAEGKRAAIRQLCFSMEHYRDGYRKLQQNLMINLNGLKS